ncbi:MAG: rRNA pseudouridine synthase [Clostridiales bacterium]|nr:rRNA pseudouridine synthase [Clostridiales bacterium]
MPKTAEKGRTPQRLDKILASQTDLSRSQAAALIRTGRVLVDGKRARSADQKADPDRAEIVIDGQPLRYEKYVYYMLNKPAGVLSASRDPDRPTVVDLVEAGGGRKGLFPVGRLDRDTTGLLLLTDDGDFAHRVISPKSGIEKIYHARLDGRVTPDMIQRFAEGVTLADGTPCLPAGLRLLEEGDAPLAEVAVQEGKYHQIKRMFGVVGLGVTALQRIRIGGLVLDKGLVEGACRPLTQAEKGLVLRAKQAKPKNAE